MSTEIDEVRTVPRRGIFQQIYRFLYSKYVGMLLILLMAVLALLGALIVQAPPGAHSTPETWSTWLDQVRPRYGGWTDVLAFLGIFNVFSSIWFSGVTILLAASIVACTTHRLPLLWRNAVHPKTRTSDGFFRHARYSDARDFAVPAATVSAALAGELKARRFRVIEDGPGIYADRFRWGPFGTAIAHAAFVMILFGMLISSVTGFESTLLITVGDRVPVGHGTDLELEVEGFEDTYHPDGRPADYVSDVVLTRGGNVVASESELRVNTPLRFEGLKIHQTTFGVATDVTITSPDGTVIHDGGVPMQGTTADGTEVLGWVTIPGQDIEIVVAAPASGQLSLNMRPGQAAFIVYDALAETTRDSVVVDQGAQATLDGYTVAFNRESKYTGLTVVRDHGAPWVWAGSLLIVLGMTMTFGFKHRRMWARVAESESGGSNLLIASSDRQDFIFETWFHEFVDAVALKCGADAQGKADDHA